MKLLKIIIATLAGLFAAAHCVQLLMNLLRDEHISRLMGNVFGICIGTIISVLLFQNVFRRSRDDNQSD